MWRATVEPESRLREVVVDRTGRSLAWRDDWEPGPFIHVVDAATGHELHRVTCAAHELVPFYDGFLALDRGWRPDRRDDDRLASRLIHLTVGGDQTELIEHLMPPKTQLVGADPGGGRTLLYREDRTVLRSWPEGSELAEWVGFQAGVDWASGCRWSRPRHPGPFVVSALDGSWERPLVGSEDTYWLRRVGDGVLRLSWHGVRVLAPRGDPLTVLAPTSRVFRYLQVDAGRTVKILLGGRPRRFTVDLDTPQVLEAPADAPHLVRSTVRPRFPPVWHPSDDLVALGDRRGRSLVMTTTGEPVCRLPDGSRPLTWFPGDRSLAVAAGLPHATFLERWRLSDPG
jgi:hypothetical protein